MEKTHSLYRMALLSLVFMSALVAGGKINSALVFESAKASGHNAYSDQAGIPEVRMNEFIVTEAGRHPLIQTYGVATCVALVLYDSRTGATGLAHFSASIHVERSVRLMLERMGSLGQGHRVEAQLLGGWKNWSEQTVTDLERALKKFKVRVVRREVLLPGGPKGLDLLPTDGSFQTPSNLSLIVDLTKQAQVSDYVETTPSSIISPIPDSSARILSPHPESF